jgi:hydroxyacylglutathione hydrolase
MIKKIASDVWKLNVDSNVYVVEGEETIIIDTGPRAYRGVVESFLSKVVDFDNVKKVIFTHLHTDHIGNFDLFPNADLFASEEEIKDFKKDPIGTILMDDVLDKFKKIELKPIKDFNSFKIIKTPGHTRGSICIYYEKEKILFSGDTLFFNENIGRTDLPNSEPEKMQNSLNKLVNYNFKILAPGHDY